MKEATAKKVFRILEKEYRTPEFARDNPYRALIGTILSQRTLDQTTDRVSEELFRIAPDSKKLAMLSEKEIAKIINPANFYKTKAKRLKQISYYIIKDFGGHIPKTREELMSLPGVGPKTADCVLSFAYGEHVIPVDTHVEVIAKRLGMADERDDYREIQKKLNKLVPASKRDSVNYLLVEHGKKICRKHLPKCNICEIRKFCKYYNNTYSH